MIDVDLLESRVMKKLYGHLGKYSGLLESVDASDDYVEAMSAVIRGLTHCIKEFSATLSLLKESKFSEKAFADIKREVHLLRNAVLEFDLRFVKILRTRSRVFLNPSEISRLEGELSTLWIDLDSELKQLKTRIKELMDRADFTQANKEAGYKELNAFMKELGSLSVEKIRSKFISNQSSLDGLFDPFDEEDL